MKRIFSLLMFNLVPEFIGMQYRNPHGERKT